MKNLTKFEKIFFIVTGVLFFFIIIFAFLSLFSSPHVRNFIIERGDSQNVAISNQRFKLKFNRPMVSDSSVVMQYIHFQPALQYRTSWINGELYLIPIENLIAYTEYSLTISKEYTDIYGNKMVEDYISKFRTRETTLAYISKESEIDDKVVDLKIQSNTSNVLYESETIKFFKKNENFLIICITNESTKTDEIIVKNLVNNSESKLSLKSQKVNQLDFSIRYNTFLYIAQDVEEKNGFLIPKSINRAYIYDIDANSSREFNPNGTALDLLDAFFSPDGETILYRASDSYYYLAGIIEQKNPISIGRFTSTGGFSKSGNQIIFSNYDPLVTYSSFPFITKFTSERQTENVTAETYAIDPIFNPGSEGEIYFAERYKEITGAQGLFQIVMSVGDEKSIRFREDPYSLELPRISQDGRYLAAEKYTQIDLLNYSNQRSFVNQRKPNKANIVIYNLVTNDKILEIENAIEVQWER